MVLIGLVLLGAVLATALLLVYPRTRLLGVALLGVGLLMMVWVAVLAVSWDRARQDRQVATVSTEFPTAEAEAHNSLGIALAAEGKTAEAIQHYQEALRLKPDDAEVHNNLGLAISAVGRTEEAIEHYRQALRLKPDYAEAQKNLQLALAARGKTNKKTPQADKSPKESAEKPQKKSAEKPEENFAEKPVEKPVENSAEEPAGETKPPADKPAAKSGNKSAVEESSSPEARPAWVDAAPQRSGDAYQMSITVGPYSTRLECDARLPEALQAAVDEYVATYLRPEAAGRVRLPAEDLRAQLVKEEWEETIQASFGPMKQLHVLLQFDHKMRGRIQEARTRAIVAGRLVYTGAGLAGGLCVLAILFAVLKLDHATRGACRGRLGLAALLALAAVAAGTVLVTTILISS